MSTKLGKQLHCGACQTNFDDNTKLSNHLKNCPAAKVILPMINMLQNDQDKVGHPLGHFVYCLKKHAELIKEYAHCVADEIPSMMRSEIHDKLCKAMDFDYKTFKPYESELITEIPTREESEVILWEAINKEAHIIILDVMEYLINVAKRKIDPTGTFL